MHPIPSIVGIFRSRSTLCNATASAAALVSVMLLWGTKPLHAQGRKLVMRGREIVVSYNPTRPSQSVGAYAIKHLRLPSNLALKDVSPGGAIAIVSPVGVSIAGAAAVEVDDADIERECARVVHENRGVPLSCEANTLRYLSKTPSDPYLGSLYGLTKMDAPSAWDVTTGSPSVMVAVVDTGVDYNHADLVENIVKNTGEIPYNNIDDDGNGYVDDYVGYDFYDRDGDPVDEFGHGTHCAGIVGARGDNATGVVGINWTVGILPVRVMGPTGGGSDADVASGIMYATQRGASIVSLSLGGESHSTVLDNAIDYARAANVLLVAAAGNEGLNNDVFPSYPANSNYDNVISVAATDSRDELAGFSNYGSVSVDVAAPGHGILSTYLANSFLTMSGTSMATPYVAGVAALMKSVQPSLGYAALKETIINTSDPLASLDGRIVSGGRVNAYRAVVAASAGVIPTPVAEPGSAVGLNRLSIASKRYSRQTFIYGHLKTERKVAVAKKYVYLKCKTISARRARSDSDGYYAFKVRRPRRAERCYAVDALKNRSRSITIK